MKNTSTYSSFNFAIVAFVCLLTLSQTSVLAQNKKGKKGKNSNTSQTKGSSSKTNLSLEDQAMLEKLLFDGILAKIKDNSEAAEASFKECLVIDSNNDAAIYELAKIYFDRQDKEQALQYARQAADLDVNNKWYQFLYAEVLAINSQYGEAAKVYERLVSNHPDNFDYYFDLSYMYMQSGQFEKAIETYDKLEEKTGIYEEVTLQKQKLYIKLGKVDKAVEEIEKLIESNPKNPQYYRALAELYDANGKKDKAIETYQKMVDLDPENPYAHLALADFYKGQGDSEKHFSELKQAFEHPELSLMIKARVLTDYLKVPETDEANKNEVFKLTDIVLKAHPKDALAYAIKGDLYYAYGERLDALDAFKKAVELDNSGIEAWQQILWIEYELRDFELLASDSKEMIEVFPNQPMPYYFNGLAYSQMEDHEKAAKSLKKASLISVEKNEMTAQIFSLLGETYNNLQEYEKSDKSYDKALEINPNNPTVLNNYGYFLSVRKNRLEDAAEMAKKANILDPTSPSFQDTYGWILYQQEKYDEAKIWLEKAISNGGENSGVILEHYGDILFKLNNIDEAVEQWEAAKAQGDASSDIDAKIKARKLVD